MEANDEYSTNKEIREIEEFGANRGYIFCNSFIHHISRSDADEFKNSVSDLSKKIRSVIEKDAPRSEIVKATEEILGFKPSFKYITESSLDDLKKFTRDLIVEVYSGEHLDYIENDEVSQEEIFDNIDNDKCGDTIHFYIYKGYVKYHEYPYVTPIANAYSSNENCNIWGAAYWLLNHKDEYDEKITFLQALLYAYYRLKEECGEKDESPLGIVPRLLLILVFYHKNLLFNSLEYYASDTYKQKVVI